MVVVLSESLWIKPTSTAKILLKKALTLSRVRYRLSVLSHIMAEDKSYYTKRPMWQWIALYVVIGGIIYFLIYYFVFARKGGYQYPSGQSGNQTQSYP